MEGRQPRLADEAAPSVTAATSILAEFPRKLEPLLGKKARYKVFHGGRGAGRSWGIVRALLIRGISEPGFRVLCAREVQSSMRESVHQLIRDQIKLMGLGAFYRVLDSEIRGPGGTIFTFKGLRDPDALKSTEGIDVVFLEEARTVTKGSWEKLDPTIRKEGSEIWISFNPELETDFIYQHFVRNTPPPDSIVVKIGWQDNAWFPEVLRIQMEHMRATDYDAYLNVWEGHCRVALEGAIYAHELRAAQREGRICKVPLDRAKPVHTFWDLGRGDLTAIWFVQIVGFEYRVVGYYQNSGFVFDHYLKHLQDEKERRGWFYGTHWLPHDANDKLLASRRTIKQQAEDAGHRTKVVTNIKISEGINAARTIFPQCWFDEEETTEGVSCLRAYRYEVDDDGTRSNKPLHDWSSHGADAFRYMGVALREEPSKTKPVPKVRAKVPVGRTAWMAR